MVTFSFVKVCPPWKLQSMAVHAFAALMRKMQARDQLSSPATECLTFNETCVIIVFRFAISCCYMLGHLPYLPFSQCSPSNPGVQTQRYPLPVKPDWQVDLFSHRGRPLFPQLFCKKEKGKLFSPCSVIKKSTRSALLVLLKVRKGWKELSCHLCLYVSLLLSHDNYSFQSKYYFIKCIYTDEENLYLNLRR